MPGCGRAFQTSRGRGVHEQKGHKNWYDEQQASSIINRKAPWTDEEVALLARQEAHLTIKGERFLNQALAPHFPNRSIEGIKGQRRYERHKQKVLELIAELREASGPPQDQVVADEHQSEAVDSLRNKIRYGIEALEPLSGTEFNAEQLELICKHIKQWSEERIFGELEIYLQGVFSAQSEVRSLKEGYAPDRTPTNRQKRRAEYAQT